MTEIVNEKNRPLALAETLAHRTWYELRVTTLVHGRKFNTRQTKQEAYAGLCETLKNPTHLKRHLKQLSPAEQRGLHHLQAAGGQMRWYEFEAAYGSIRPYRPWDHHEPRQSWKRPISVAEKLWFMGFIEIIEEVVYLPAEILDVLPPLPRVNPLTPVESSPLLTRQHLLRDITVLMGLLMREDVRPIWGRWLPPRLLHHLNRHFSAAEDLTDIRSELPTQRLRLVHYLAAVSGLIAEQNGVLKPTVTGWTWLAQSPDQQWAALWAAWDADLRSCEPLWTMYRLPEIDRRVWEVLWAQLNRLQASQTYGIKDLLGAMLPYLPPQQDWTAIADFLCTILAWAGVVKVEGRTFSVVPTVFQSPQDGEWVAEGDRIWLELPEFPRQREMVAFYSWGSTNGRDWWVDEAAVGRAVGMGYDAVQMVAVMSNWCDQVLPMALLEQVQAWEQRANRLTLRHLVVLTSSDSQLLADIRADRQLRRMIQAPLSAHHVALKPHYVRKLSQRLRQRGFQITPIKSPSPSTRPSTKREVAAYFWLAGRVYQGLSKLVDVPIHLPGTIAEVMGEQLSAAQRDHIEQTAEAILAALAQAVAGYATTATPVTQDDGDRIRVTIEAAYEKRSAVTIDYFSPYEGKQTRRTIEPIMPLSEHNGAWYVEAWCQMAEAERTFRLDRIVRIVEG